MDVPHFVDPLLGCWTLVCSHLLAIKTLLKCSKHLCPQCGHLVSFPLGIYLGVKLPGCMVTLYLSSSVSARLFSKAAVPFSNPTSSAGTFQSLHVLASLGFSIYRSGYSHPSGGKWHFLVDSHELLRAVLIGPPWVV